eukprot:10154544-Lingulodinium_polyedra.AAC.1
MRTLRGPAATMAFMVDAAQVKWLQTLVVAVSLAKDVPSLAFVGFDISCEAGKAGILPLSDPQ